MTITPDVKKLKQELRKANKKISELESTNKEFKDDYYEITYARLMRDRADILRDRRL